MPNITKSDTNISLNRTEGGTRSSIVSLDDINTVRIGSSNMGGLNGLNISTDGIAGGQTSYNSSSSKLFDASYNYRGRIAESTNGTFPSATAFLKVGTNGATSFDTDEYVKKSSMLFEYANTRYTSTSSDNMNQFQTFDYLIKYNTTIGLCVGYFRINMYSSIAGLNSVSLLEITTPEVLHPTVGSFIFIPAYIYRSNSSSYGSDLITIRTLSSGSTRYGEVSFGNAPLKSGDSVYANFSYIIPFDYKSLV